MIVILRTPEPDNFFTKPYKDDYLISHIRKIVAPPLPKEEVNYHKEVEIVFNVEKWIITANQSQMLPLLFSTHE